jgi:hypothetical protein
MIKKKCQNCNKSFMKSPSEINRTKRHFCSKDCSLEFNRGENHPGYECKPFQCVCCGNTFLRTPNRVLRASRPTCSPGCKNKIHPENISGVRNGNWKGGEFITRAGYKFIRIGIKKYIQEHRYVMQNYICRVLSNNEVVHHENGNKLDNRPRNLSVMTQSEHAKIHRCDIVNRFVTYLK